MPDWLTRWIIVSQFLILACLYDVECSFECQWTVAVAQLTLLSFLECVVFVLEHVYLADRMSILYSESVSNLLRYLPIANSGWIPDCEAESGAVTLFKGNARHQVAKDLHFYFDGLVDVGTLNVKCELVFLTVGERQEIVKGLLIE